VYWPTTVPVHEVRHWVVLPDGTSVEVPHPEPSEPPVPDPVAAPVARHREPPVAEETRRVELGRICGARSGDKGGNANIGLWTRTDEAYIWLDQMLTIERLGELLPEARELEVRRFTLPNLRAINIVVVGLLGAGVSSSTRPDPQAKGLGEYLRGRLVEIPTRLLD